jgi:hypothetical protein
MVYGGSAVAVAAIVQCEFEAPFDDPLFTDSTFAIDLKALSESATSLVNRFVATLQRQLRT